MYWWAIFLPRLISQEITHESSRKHVSNIFANASTCMMVSVWDLYTIEGWAKCTQMFALYVCISSHHIIVAEVWVCVFCSSPASCGDHLTWLIYLKIVSFRGEWRREVIQTSGHIIFSSVQSYTVKSVVKLLDLDQKDAAKLLQHVSAAFCSCTSSTLTKVTLNVIFLQGIFQILLVLLLTLQGGIFSLNHGPGLFLSMRGIMKPCERNFCSEIMGWLSSQCVNFLARGQWCWERTTQKAEKYNPMYSQLAPLWDYIDILQFVKIKVG